MDWFKTPVHYAIQALAFDLIAFNGVRDSLRRVMVKVVVLPKHRPQTADLPEQPLQGGMPFAQLAAQ